MQKQNEFKNYYDPSSPQIKRLGILLITMGAVIFAVFAFLAFRAANDRRFKSELQSEFLCTLQRPCQLEVILTYDKEPVDVNLITPSGQTLSSRNMDIYEEQDGRIVMAVTTKELGDWGIEYNYKTNRDLRIQTNELQVEQVFLSNIQRFTSDPRPGEPMDYYISILAGFGDGTDKETEINCYIVAMKTGAMPVQLHSGTLKLNTQTNLELNLEELESGEYTLRIQTSGKSVENDGYDKYADTWEEELSWENRKDE